LRSVGAIRKRGLPGKQSAAVKLSFPTENLRAKMCRGAWKHFGCPESLAVTTMRQNRAVLLQSGAH
jgi:hypothetical protein